VRTTLERLSLRDRPFAIVAHIDGEHFVNIVDSLPGEIVIVDPPELSRISPAALNARWDGTALLVSLHPLAREEDLHPPLDWRKPAGWTLLVVGVAAALWRLFVLRKRRVGT
jgi:hypothetical protein